MNSLFIVSTPIGNIEDITIRALKVLFEADVIACEDTRRTGQLLKIYDLRFKNHESNNKGKLISFYDEVEENKTQEIIELIKDGKKVALVSDAGTPLISDPGFKLVRECIKNNIQIISVPGPSAVIAALSISGLPTNQFLFLGYPPPKTGARLKLLSNIKSTFEHSQIRPTIIFFESPHKIHGTLEDLKSTFGDIEIVICRELTKIHEEVIRDNISKILTNNNLKGEICILF